MDRKQATNIEVKKNNRNRIFRYICKNGTVSNPDISYELKISLPTVTQITKELIERKLVKEIGEMQSTGGRRAKALAIAADAGQAVGVDITKNHISLVFTDLMGEIIKYERIFKPYETKETYCREVNERLEHFLEESGCRRENLLGIGISFPGIIDLEGEKVADSHILGVRDLPFASISRFFSFPCHFLNDANAGAYAEGIRTEGQERFFYLSLSNTVGGAVFGNGRLEHGKNFRCGEVGHMTIIPGGEDCYCGKQGCLDAYCSAKCLSDAVNGKLDVFFKKLRQGEREARQLWDTYTDYLAIAVNNLHMVLDCDIILGGYVGSSMGENIQEIQKKVSERNTFAETGAFVRTCSHKKAAAALGAALKVIETFIEQV
ncbi:MAG: ROK family transcriptional regulator [Lachnospiraceae bacterium]|nr:ROK family transcriptional regulator [Lachnospiraceae bacterium]